MKHFDYDYLIVGCGLSGCVIAEQLANKNNKKSLIIEKRDHIGGNCYDYIDNETGILMNKYGAHLFHTNNERVWEYINNFGIWKRWEHKVLSYVDNRFVSIPVNITTVNEVLNENLQNEYDIQEWLDKNQIKYDEIKNSEEMAKSRIGEKLYEKMVKNYTFKQWSKYPNELDKSVLARIPVRPNFDTRYFSDKYQALPEKGYTFFFEKLLDNDLIEYRLNVDFFEFKKQYDLKDIPIIYTGPIDTYFSDIGLEKLEYRSIDFHIERYKNMNFYQPCGAVNYPGNEKSYTRIIEYKHFLNQKSPHTIIVGETTNDKGEPYYPVPNERNLQLYEKYKSLADLEQKNNKIFFVGRLANYKYFNMDQAIDNALYFFESELN
jgi:UDP-galactopyranose mutase